MSPQSLQPKIRGQATPADPYAGWGMSAAQNDLPTGIDFIRTLVKKFTNPNDPMGPIAMEAPLGAGMVLSERNIPKLVEQIAKWNEVTGNLRASGNNPAQLAMNYLRFKYPKLMDIPAAFHEPKTMPADIRGAYIPGRHIVQLNTDNLPDIPKAVSTVMHEVMHAFQDRQGTLGNPEDYLYPNAQNLAQYLDQPSEMQANQAGSTAKATYLKFLNKIAEMRAAQGK